MTIFSGSALALLLIFFPAPTQQHARDLANVLTALKFLSASETSERKVTAYTLPPDLYRKARHLAQIAFWGQIVLFLYSIVALLLILKWRLAPKYRTWAEKASSNRFVQAAIFSPLILLTIAILESPGDIAQHWVSRKFGAFQNGDR